MNILSKRTWKIWFIVSIILFTIHLIFIGLKYHWDIFSFHMKEIVFITNSKDALQNFIQQLFFTDWYPRILNACTIPLFYFLFLVLYRKTKGKKDLGSRFFQGILSIVNAGLIAVSIFLAIAGFIYGMMYLIVGLGVALAFGLFFIFSTGFIGVIASGIVIVVIIKLFKSIGRLEIFK